MRGVDRAPTSLTVASFAQHRGKRRGGVGSTRSSCASNRSRRARLSRARVATNPQHDSSRCAVGTAVRPVNKEATSANAMRRQSGPAFLILATGVECNGPPSYTPIKRLRERFLAAGRRMRSDRRGQTGRAWRQTTTEDSDPLLASHYAAGLAVHSPRAR